jgi:pimeloyl-ACP methyl ester carboxylesterase
VLTPGYPGIGQGEEGLLALREDSSALASVGVREVMDHLTGIVEDLDTPPIIMGHSFGGTFAQLLVGNGLGAAGVSIDSAAVKGINAMPLSEIRSVLPALKDPANLHRAVPLTPRQFHYAFTNTLSEEASQAAYDRYAAPPPPGSCSRAASRRSPRTPPPPSTSPTTTGHRCCSSPAAATTSCPRSSSGTTTKRTPSTPPRSPRMPSSRGATTSPAASPAGKRSPTSPSTGRSPRYPGSSSRDRAFSLTSHQ